MDRSGSLPGGGWNESRFRLEWSPFHGRSYDGSEELRFENQFFRSSLRSSSSGFRDQLAGLHIPQHIPSTVGLL